MGGWDTPEDGSLFHLARIHFYGFVVWLVDGKRRACKAFKHARGLCLGAKNDEWLFDGNNHLFHLYCHSGLFPFFNIQVN